MPWRFTPRTCARAADFFHARRTDSIRLFRPKAFWAGNIARYFTLSILVGLGCSVLHAQITSEIEVPSSPKRVYGAFDKDIAVPDDAVGPLGRKDSGALTELTSHLKAVGASPWIGMVGTGQITYGTKDSTAYGATLSILGSSWFRLDGETSSGPLSVRISLNHGAIQEPDGRQFPVPPDTAATGIFQFAQLRLSNFPGEAESLLDRGPIVVDGVSLHRMTVEFPSVSRDPATGAHKGIATDLYFDPVSHLLVKSANSIRLDGGHDNDFLRVITYGDYRKVGDSMIPFSYTQTLNGQKQWTLQLTNVQLNPTLNPTFFEF
ncbi:hypothetical protein P8936_15230 [Edaphobacter paludis]|uniref:Outer membrane lipoprotein-sorting protein n=1 Tax=Edaphobacter paludis TaxID=3035702 RepID=A0AAU7D6U8_9BACT